MIIPFFIPHSGCPHQCVFCNQRNIIGQNRSEEFADIPGKINNYLATHTTGLPIQVAFYGGTFTALPLETQVHYLDAIQPFIESGQIQNVRLSTRPDYINSDILSLLKKYSVTIIELGAQSMDDTVLALSGRGHTAEDTVKAVMLLRQFNFSIGLQLMPGLPGDSAALFRETVHRAIALKPDFVRLYPALVIKDTVLEKLFTDGRYTPLALEEAVVICREACLEFEKAGITVVRMGLPSTEELEKPGTILAGPYHPAFRQLVESSLFLDRMRTALQGRLEKQTTAVFCVNRRDLSSAIGQQRENIKRLQQEYGLADVRIVEGKDVRRGDITLLAGGSILLH